LDKWHGANRRIHIAETTNQHSPHCDRQRIDQSSGSQQVAVAAFSFLGLSRYLASRFGGQIKTFPFIEFYFYLKLLFFTIFMKVFI
jgi:hypothetical protein